MFEILQHSFIQFVSLLFSAATAPARPTTETSVRATSTDEHRTQTATHVTSPPSEAETFTPPHTGVTETCVTSKPDTNTVCTLVVVIVVLCVLLLVVCFLVVQQRRKRNNKTVMPGRSKEEKEELEDDRSSNPDQSPGHSENRDAETAQRRPFSGVRAKSANAILFISPFCVSEKDQVTVQHETEAQSKDTEGAEGEQKPENEAGGFQTENITNTPDTTEGQTDAGSSRDDNSHRVSVSTDTVAYLSIGNNQNKPNPDNLSKQLNDSLGQRSQMGKVMGRISTWPPTAIQWQERCKVMEEASETEKHPGEAKKTVNREERPSVCDRDTKEKEKEENHMEGLITSPNKLKMNVAGMKLKFSEVQAHTDTKQEEPATVTHTGNKTQSLNQEKLSHNQDLKPAENSTHKSSSKAQQRDEAKRAVTNRQRAENRSTGSKTRSDGASPDDETLLYGNEYAFMDLLHEVVQNNGRWTRERWKQMNVNKQRR
ncbi:uncharacterized protein LOC130169218 [Seriola aureovittata]|uniref:uncharacterized protein LOC130169218 n=1 Tax=Seriola aureovittata TaxID=2871759 RepID=UPI0024BDBE8A|nr:uncharacterized protein LOC130169218 [Seriola aureovittata]